MVENDILSSSFYEKDMVMQNRIQFDISPSILDMTMMNNGKEEKIFLMKIMRREKPKIRTLGEEKERIWPEVARRMNILRMSKSPYVTLMDIKMFSKRM